MNSIYDKLTALDFIIVAIYLVILVADRLRSEF